ncbi:hypothetical protein MM236_19535, partial [Belliella sp. DSM 107340]|nr:hypothetical protein [Belliella calami]
MYSKNYLRSSQQSSLLRASVFLLFFIFPVFSITAQNIIQVSGNANNVPIKEVSLIVNKGGEDEFIYTQKERGMSNPIPENVSVEIESILLANGERIFATSRFPEVKSANELLGTSINPEGIRVIKFDHSSESEFLSHSNNLDEFLRSLSHVVSVPDLRSYWDINSNDILNEFSPFVDVIYPNQIPQSGYILISERNGNSKMDLVPLDENGEVIVEANRISFIAQFDWNTGVNHQINYPDQKQWLTVFNPELFDSEIPIFGFRVFDRLESDGKIIFFARDLSAAPDNLCPIFASVGSENAGNIFQNDELDGIALNPQDINLSVFDDQGVLSLGFIQLDQDPSSPTFGNISVSPNATPGNYAFEYEIEDKLDGRTDRAQVTVRIIEFLELESNTYCEGQQADELFISSNRVSGFTYNWYVNSINSNQGGTLITEETSPRLVPPTSQEGVYYYYVVVTNDCGESLTSSVAEITVLTTDAPLATGNITECALESIQTLNANDAIIAVEGTEIVWFNSPDGEDLVTAPILNEIGSVTYYAEAVNQVTGCSSILRTPVVLTLDDCRLAIVKSVDLLEIDGPTILNFTIEVTNPGTVAATGVVVTDPLTNGNEPLQLLEGDDNGDNVLDLNETWIYQTTYEVSQELIDLGLDIVNTAFVNANETPEFPSSTTTVVNNNSSISLSKTADKTAVSEAGEVIIYTLTVTNTGNTTLTDVLIIDAKLGVEENIGTLSPGESSSISASYTVTQEDIDSGSILNAASVEGTDPNGEIPEGSDEVETPVNQNSNIVLSKTADKTAVSEAGEVIVYTLTVTNTGNTTLTDVLIIDAKLGVEENIGTLSPGESSSISVSYTVTQEDIDSGSILNAASVEGTDPNGETPEGSDEVETPVDQNSSIALSKTADKTAVSEAGEVIVYTLTVTNTGNTTLTDVLIIDAKLGVEENIGTLSPGESSSISVSYTVTQEDIDSGSILNAASVEGTDPN